MDLIGSYVFRIFEFWNRFELDGGRIAALGSLDFPGNFQDTAGGGWFCSWRAGAINQSDSDNWWNNGPIDNDTREKIVFAGWNWLPTSFRGSV